MARAVCMSCFGGRHHRAETSLARQSPQDFLFGHPDRIFVLACHKPFNEALGAFMLECEVRWVRVEQFCDQTCAGGNSICMAETGPEAEDQVEVSDGLLFGLNGH